ncbi:hypothetical protein U8335_19575 [Roseiconus lacunae]|uniref:hypothetical protein n=1 Tax=Roseiconus lacunae TaxID=2605694 RepID=UPI00308F47D2|nr:hypothetical protein U8335_19575 [Stieleria sp. HD01]
MGTFRDNMNQEWTLTLTMGRIRKLSSRLGIDLMNPEQLCQLSSSLTDRMAFVFLLCEDQAREYEIDADEFEERLSGDGFVDAASDALMATVVDYLRRFGQGQLAKLAQKQLEVMQLARGRLNVLVESGEFDNLLNQAAAEVLAE